MYKELMYVTQVQLYNYKNPYSRIRKLCETLIFKCLATYPSMMAQIQEILINTLNKIYIYF